MTIAKAWPLAGCIVLIGCSPESRSASLTRSSALEGKRAAHGASVEHVVLLSIDGFHQLDFDNWVASHPASTLASLAARGTSYTNVTSSRSSGAQ